MTAEKSVLTEIKPIEDGKAGLGLVNRLAKRKRNNAQKHLEKQE